MIRRPPRSSLCPYATLFRSQRFADLHRLAHRPVERALRQPADLAVGVVVAEDRVELVHPLERGTGDRKSTRLNSSHANISYSVFCLKKKSAYHQHLLCCVYV